jgi:hypothetical protein
MRGKILPLLLSLLICCYGFAQDSTRKPSLEVFGFVMADIGYDTKQINPNWFDALRVTKLPTYANQYAPDGKVFFGVRQTRFGVKGYTPTAIGDLKTLFDFDLFGVGVDEGQTTMRLRNAYGELGRFLVGQANSPFMDGDVFPNTVEYWGPTGMVFFRNVQFRFAPMRGNHEVFIALERPGASADQGSFADRTELDSVRGKLDLPDLSAHYKRSGQWGHVQIAGMLRSIKWEDIHTTGGYNISGSTTGWGLHLSSVLNIGKSNVFRGSVIYGAGVENYMNDAPVDLGIDLNGGSTSKPVKGTALPVTGVSAFLDHNWDKIFATSIGYSFTHIDNTDYGSPNAYKNGHYAIVNLIATPFPNFMMVAEVQYGKRENFKDGFSSDDVKIHFAFKYNFSQVFYFDKR